MIDLWEGITITLELLSDLKVHASVSLLQTQGHRNEVITSVG